MLGGSHPRHSKLGYSETTCPSRLTFVAEEKLTVPVAIETNLIAAAVGMSGSVYHDEACRLG